jgi:2-phosphoglycolate phosphatase
MKYTVNTVIFDFDGVLVDTGPDIANAANDTLLYLRQKPLPQSTLIAYIGGGAEMLLRRALKAQADDLLSQALPYFLHRYEEFCCVETHLYPHVREVLDYYQVLGKHMVIATQKNEAITRTILHTLEIESYFDWLIGPESVTHRKPHPESVLLALEKPGADPRQAVMIGDTASDIQAGKAAGTTTCGVFYGYGAADDVLQAQPDFILDQHLGQIIEWID